MWSIDADTIESITLGAAILGTGGGGNPYIGKLRALDLLNKGKRIDVIDIEDLADDAHVVCCGGMGAPVVGIEKIARGDEILDAVRAVVDFAGVRLDAIIPAEVGGGNSIAPMIAAGLAGVPIVDADAMGRAFPELQMSTYFIYGVSPVPAALADVQGNIVIFSQAVDALRLERMARACCVQMGGTASAASPLMTGAEVKRTAVPHSLSLARRIGKGVREARTTKADPVAAALSVAGGQVIFRGKVVDVERRVAQGFARGRLMLEGFEDFAGHRLEVEFQNENLVAWLDERAVPDGDGRQQQRGRPIAMVPDLICIVDSQTADPITTEVVRYGLRVSVLGIPCTEMLCTPEALAVVGPRAFGYDLDFTALARDPVRVPNSAVGAGRLA
ncbi:MAG: DUF917 domain-containing protein [Dehalococcoidia bacterium]